MSTTTARAAATFATCQAELRQRALLTPAQREGTSYYGLANEHLEQAIFFAMLDRYAGRYPEIIECYWTAGGMQSAGAKNDAARQAIAGMKKKLLGFRKGRWDIALDARRGSYSGLRMEFKQPKGSLTPEQKTYRPFLDAQGFYTCVARSWEEGIELVSKYLDGEV